MFICLVIPIKLYNFIRENRSKLRKPEFKEQFYSAYLSIGYYKIASLSWQCLSLYRKLAFVITIVYFKWSSLTQMTIIVYL